MDLQEWTIFVTNCPPEMLTWKEVVVLYRARWQIELLFKLWKSHNRLAQQEMNASPPTADGGLVCQIDRCACATLDSADFHLERRRTQPTQGGRYRAGLDCSVERGPRRPPTTLRLAPADSRLPSRTLPASAAAENIQVCSNSLRIRNFWSTTSLNSVRMGARCARPTPTRKTRTGNQTLKSESGGGATGAPSRVSAFGRGSHFRPTEICKSFATPATSASHPAQSHGVHIGLRRIALKPPQQRAG